MLKNYLQITIRTLIKNKIYSIINIVGLATGITCAVLILLWVQYELSYDRLHKNADRLFRVGFTTEQKDFYGFFQPGPLAKYLKDNFPEIEQSSNYAEIQSKLSDETKGFFCSGAIVSPNFFQMFSFQLEEGNLNNVLNNLNSVVISKSFSQKIFGSEDPIGKTLKLNDYTDFMVTGIFFDVPKTSILQFDFVIPFSNAPGYMNMWDRKSVNTYVLLDKDASFDEVNKKIHSVMNVFNPTWKNILYLFPFTKSHLYDPDGKGLILYVYIFSLFGILILIVACINFMNLSTARSEKRMKEIGVKKTLGSSRLILIKQFLFETILYSFISLLIAVILVEFSLPYLNNILGTHISMIYSGSMIFMLLGLTLLTGLIAGSYPAFYLSSLHPMSVLNSRTSIKGERRSLFLRKTLVIAQFTFSVFVITCVLFMGSQLNFIQSRDLGFNKEQVLLISTRGALQQKVKLVKDELLKNPSILTAAVSATDLTGFQGAGTGPVEWEGKKTDKVLEVGFNFVDEDFARTLQVKMTEGRFFSKDFTNDMSESFVVNEAAVKAMGMKNPINKGLATWFGRKGKIVGVISNFNTQSLRDEMTPIVLIPTAAANYLYLHISSGNIPATIKYIERKIKNIVPDDPFEYKFLDNTIDNLYKSEQMIGKLSTFIAVLAIFISCLGLFGLTSFSSERRRKEIGVRKVLGASLLNVLIILTKDFTKWILLANLLAWPLAWYVMNKWLQDFAYRIELTWWMFALAGGIALVIAFATVSIQAIKAATANPIESLRYE